MKGGERIKVRGETSGSTIAIYLSMAIFQIYYSSELESSQYEYFFPNCFGISGPMFAWENSFSRLTDAIVSSSLNTSYYLKYLLCYFLPVEIKKLQLSLGERELWWHCYWSALFLWASGDWKILSPGIHWPASKSWPWLSFQIHSEHEFCSASALRMQKKFTLLMNSTCNWEQLGNSCRAGKQRTLLRHLHFALNIRSHRELEHYL